MTDTAKQAGELLDGLERIGALARSGGPRAAQAGELLAAMLESGAKARAREERQATEAENARMDEERARIAETAVKVEIDHQGRVTFETPGGDRIMVPGGERQSGNWTEAFAEFCTGEDADAIAAANADSEEMAAIGGEFERSMEVLGMSVMWRIEKDGGKVSRNLVEYASQKHLGACRVHEMKRALAAVHEGDPSEREGIAGFRAAKIAKDVDRGIALSKTAGEGKWADGLLQAA